MLPSKIALAAQMTVSFARRCAPPLLRRRPFASSGGGGDGRAAAPSLAPRRASLRRPAAAAVGAPAAPDPRLAHVRGPTDAPLLSRTVDGVLAAAAAAHGAREALLVPHQGVRLTYAALDEAVERCARGLAGAGLRPGDRLGIWAPNCAEWVITMFAAARAGLVLVNVNPACVRCVRRRVRSVPRVVVFVLYRASSCSCGAALGLA